MLQNLYEDFHAEIQNLAFNYLSDLFNLKKSISEQKIFPDDNASSLSWKYFNKFCQITSIFKTKPINPKFEYLNPFDKKNKPHFVNNDTNKSEAIYFYCLKKYNEEITPIKFRINLLTVIIPEFEKIKLFRNVIHFDPFLTIYFINYFYDLRFLFEISDKFQLKMGDKLINELIANFNDIKTINTTKKIKTEKQYFEFQKNLKYYNDYIETYEFFKQNFEVIPIGEFLKIAKLDRLSKIQKNFFQNIYQCLLLENDDIDYPYNNAKHKILFPLITSLNPIHPPHEEGSPLYKKLSYGKYYDNYKIDYMKATVEGK